MKISNYEIQTNILRRDRDCFEIVKPFEFSLKSKQNFT